jgi:hypothetical protein
MRQCQCVAGCPHAGALQEPKPLALTRIQTRSLHDTCLSRPARPASFDACTALIQSGQLPRGDTSRYLEQRALVCAARGDYVCAAADLRSAVEQDPRQQQRLRQLQGRYEAERDARK